MTSLVHSCAHSCPKIKVSLLEVVGLIHVAHNNDKIWLIHYNFIPKFQAMIRFTAPIRFSSIESWEHNQRPFSLKAGLVKENATTELFSVYFFILTSLDLKSNGGTIKWDTEKQKMQVDKI